MLVDFAHQSPHLPCRLGKGNPRKHRICFNGFFFTILFINPLTTGSALSLNQSHISHSSVLQLTSPFESKDKFQQSTSTTSGSANVQKSGGRQFNSATFRSISCSVPIHVPVAVIMMMMMMIRTVLLTYGSNV